MIDFQLRSNLPRALSGHVRDSHQTTLGHKAANVFSVTLAHFTNAENPDA
jgi:hypothetical protein